MSVNIFLSGMGGQGLVLTTNIICQAAMNAGYDVKSNDVVGLSQRGGMVWGNVRIGKNVFSPNIPAKKGDFLLAMEPLEGLRWSSHLKDEGTIVMDSKQINPVIVQQGQSDYPVEKIKKMKSQYNTIVIDAFEKAVKIGKSQVANIILVGILASQLENTDFSISKNTWLETIREMVPQKAIQMNEEAFMIGLNYK